MKNLKKFIVPITCTLIGIGCLSAFHIIGGYLDSDGVLHEPFALLPIGFLFLLFGVGWYGSIVIKNLYMKNNIVMKNLKKFIVPITCTLIGIGCLSAFHIIGARIDSDGVLHEPFALLPIGFLFLLSGVGWYGNIVIKNLFLPITSLLVGVLFFGLYHWIGVDLFVFSSVGAFLICVSVFWILSLAFRRIKPIFFSERLQH